MAQLECNDDKIRLRLTALTVRRGALVPGVLGAEAGKARFKTKGGAPNRYARARPDIYDLGWGET